MKLPTVSVEWQSLAIPANTRHTNMVITIIHGQTLYNYLNVSREEVERRFQEVMDERNPIMAAREPTVATALTTCFDDEFCLWLNAGDEIREFGQNLIELLSEQSDVPQGHK